MFSSLKSPPKNQGFILTLLVMSRLSQDMKWEETRFIAHFLISAETIESFDNTTQSTVLWTRTRSLRAGGKEGQQRQCQGPVDLHRQASEQ